MGTEDKSFSFGVISDVQYADHDDALPHFPPFRNRFYRHGLRHIELAVEEFKSINADFILQLGDIIDGKNGTNSEEALKKVLDTFSAGGIRVHHTIGNHDLYNLTHEQAVQQIVHSSTAAASNVGYYSFISHNFRFINLDCYNVAMLGRSKEETAYKSSEGYLSVNPNSDLNSPTGLEGEERRFLKFNGAIGEEQLDWLSQELMQAEQNNEKVVVFGHCGLLPGATHVQCMLWNYQEVLSLLENSPSVVLVLAGHNHYYKHKVSPAGKHHVTLRGVIETPPDEKAWALVTVTNKCIKLKVYDGSMCEDLMIPL